MKALSNLSRLTVQSDYLLQLIKVYEAKGKEFYYDALFEKDKDVFRRKTLEDNCYHFAKILDLPLTNPRIKLLSKRNMTPKNKTEQLFLNIKQALNAIQKWPENFEAIPAEFEDLAKLLSKKYELITYVNLNERDDSSIFATTNSRKKQNDLDLLTKKLEEKTKTNQYELTQLIANFYIDYINLEPFNMHNDIISFIILYAFLIKEFSVFKYISFFKYLHANINEYNQALAQANYYYRTGFPDVDVLLRVTINILTTAYEAIDKLAHEYSFEIKLNKGDNIEATIRKGKEIFTKDELRQNHPTIAEITINRTLKRLKDEGLIQPLGKGRGAKWQRLDERQRKGVRQLDIFHFTD